VTLSIIFFFFLKLELIKEDKSVLYSFFYLFLFYFYIFHSLVYVFVNFSKKIYKFFIKSNLITEGNNFVNKSKTIIILGDNCPRVNN
jgi:hypothetical protein